MRQLTSIETHDVCGGETSWPQAAVGGAAVWAPIQIAGGPAIVNGTVAGVVGATPSLGIAGGTVVGIGVVPVALVVTVAVGGAVLGNAIGNSDLVQGWAESAGTWLGNHGIVW